MQDPKKPEQFDLKFEEVPEVDPLELVANTEIQLHHHMAPPGGVFDLDDEDEE